MVELDGQKFGVARARARVGSGGGGDGSLNCVVADSRDGGGVDRWQRAVRCSVPLVVGTLSAAAAFTTGGGAGTAVVGTRGASS